MSDKPFIGYPGAPHPKKRPDSGPPKLAQDTWLDDFIKGFLGETEASGSVLDEQTRDKHVTANDIGQRLGAVANFPSPKALLPLIGMAGAIRIGGAKDLLSHHAFGAHYAPDIAKSGYLDTPSIGVTSRQVNDYAPLSPQMIFSAGKVDPIRLPGQMVNRDGYFYNPSGRKIWDPSIEFDPETLKASIEYGKSMGAAHTGRQELRLGQMWPADGQALAIAASPSFESFHEFEKSPYGAQLLRVPARLRESYWNATSKNIREATHERMDTTGKYLTQREFTEDLIRRMDAGDKISEAEAKLWMRAANSPSGMAEFKVMDKLPISPADTSIYVPPGSLGEDKLKLLEGFRDAGYPMFTDSHLASDTFPQAGMSPQMWLPKRLMSVASDRGGFNLPKLGEIPAGKNAGLEKWQRENWNSFITPGAGGSPPLSVADKTAAKLEEALKPQPIEEAAGVPSLTSLFSHFDGPPPLQPSKALQPKYEEMINNADEFPLTAEAWAEKKGLPASMHDEIVKHTYDAYKADIHKHGTQWHKVLESYLDHQIFPQF